MYPNQPTPQPTPQPPLQPVDYLNQISPQAPKKQLFSLTPKFLIFVGGILVILVLILVGVVNSIAASQKEPMQKLVARLATTETIAIGAQDNLKSSELRSLNSNLKIYFTNTNRDIAEPLSTVNIDVTELNESIKKAEAGEDISSRLENARLNAVYDRTYAREMAYQLATIMTLMQQIYGSTGSESLKTYLNSAYENLEPTQKALEDFNAANG